uniref:Uncharacterized protein n=1 Tax=viral metagenome TaxID=1070528 RepID=A0A6M3Y300_9ZZZZ
MTKQEEIRKGIRDGLKQYHHLEMYRNPIDDKTDYLKVITETLMNRLHSKGVVIRVERESPRVILESANRVAHAIGRDFVEGRITYDDYTRKFDKVFTHAQKKLEYVGYVAVIPLKEAENG